jgi:myo-inositol-1(or 4)-monophosphatase
MTTNDPSPALPFSDNDLANFLAIAKVAARKGGEVLQEMLGKAETWSKGPGDLVTAADFESQRVIRECLLFHFPEHDFLGEEAEELEQELKPTKPAKPVKGVEADNFESKRDSRFCWIVDPLDGTTNFVHQLPGFAVSIGLRLQGVRDTLIVGCVYEPLTDQMFSAALGQGATQNDVPIRVSKCTELDAALLVFSMNSQVPRTDPQTVRLLNVLERAHTVRRLGSAALNLCLVASGKLDGYWATNLKTWDIAAGWLIATEAGATLDSFDERPLDISRPAFCCTATPELFEQLKPLLQ